MEKPETLDSKKKEALVKQLNYMILEFMDLKKNTILSVLKMEKVTFQWMIK